MLDIVKMLQSAGNVFLSLFKKEDKSILAFFAPLIAQVKAEALILGKNDLEAGFTVLKHAALAAAAAAVVAPPGTKVAFAEAAFLQVAGSEGVTAIKNAEAAVIKAAVAIVQTQAPSVVAHLTANPTAEIPPTPETALASSSNSTGNTA